MSRSSRVPAGDVTPDVLEELAEDVLPALIARLRASHLGELEVRTERWHVRLRRDGVTDPAAVAANVTGAQEAGPEELPGSVARSPGVGYFIPATDLAVGAEVQAGDLIGSIDVLGIELEVVAPADGIVSQVLTEEGQAVEYGQALVEIDVLELQLELALEPEAAAAPDPGPDAAPRGTDA